MMINHWGFNEVIHIALIWGEINSLDIAATGCSMLTLGVFPDFAMLKLRI